MASTRVRWAGLAGAIAVVGAVLLLPTGSAAASASATAAVPGSAPGPAVAEPPFRLPTQITDRAGALSGGDEADVQAAINQLASEDNVNLFVVYVQQFDSPSGGQDWAAQTYAASDLGANDMLLAIATEGRDYSVQVPPNFKLSSSQLSSVDQNDIRPQLVQEDWAGAAIAAADGYRDALGGSSATWWWVAGGVVVVGGGGYLIYRRLRRRTGDKDAGGQPLGPDGQPQAPLEPLDQLSERSVQALIDTDNAVRASEFELSAAETEFGHDAVTQFRGAFEAARESLTAAFEIRQKVDDDIPEDDDTKRAMMNEILQRCADASAKLDSESDRFDDLRDLRSRLPQVLAELPGAIESQNARLGSVGVTLQRLQQQYAPNALATVAGNVPEATSRLTFARTSLQQAQQLVAGVAPAEVTAGVPAGAGTAAPAAGPPTTPQNPGAPAVLAAGAAQEAVGQAQTLLDAVERTESDLAAAAGQVAQACSAVDQELTAARTALSEAEAGAAGTGLRAQLDQVQAILGVARSPQGAADPLTALSKVQEADLALDTILAQTRDAQQQEQRARAGLAQALANARAEVASAEDYVTTRRGAVGSQARTRLAEAKRHLAAAEST
ncbi:MAG TPA: TPM domain-containing protein, partial [Nakamurella sp.]